MRLSVSNILITALALLPPHCLLAKAADQPSITLTISGPQTVIVGEKILIKVAVENASKRTIPMMWGTPYIRLIHDKKGKEIPQNPEWDGSMGLGSIEPGKIVKESVLLGLEHDLVPGEYVVQFERHLDDNDPKSPLIKSNEITITVVPPKKEGQQ